MTDHKATPSVGDLSELPALGLTLQCQGLELLLAEMRALAAMMPTEQNRLSTDAEIEAEVDNMPV
jgi:hypothetical protein